MLECMASDCSLIYDDEGCRQRRRVVGRDNEVIEAKEKAMCTNPKLGVVQ